jgi:hypothetical protein
MNKPLSLMRQQANHTRYQSGQQAGHYESFFLRANLYWLNTSSVPV